MQPDQLRDLAARLHHEADTDTNPASAEFGHRLAGLFDATADAFAGFPEIHRCRLANVALSLADATELLYAQEPEAVPDAE